MLWVIRLAEGFDCLLAPQATEDFASQAVHGHLPVSGENWHSCFAGVNSNSRNRIWAPGGWKKGRSDSGIADVLGKMPQSD